MFTASVINKNVIIYSSDAITGMSTGYLYVFANNVFHSISSFTFTTYNSYLTLFDSILPNESVTINVFPGGITTSVGINTVIAAANQTSYVDNYVPSFQEMIEHGAYNYTSFTFSNFITGITTQANFPSANLTLKRNPPTGSIIINEGYLAPMKVHRFAGLSSSIFSVAGSGTTFSTPKSFAFDYTSYGDQILSSINFSIGAISTLPSNSIGYISINEDYFNAPSPVSVGVSTMIDFSGQQPNEYRMSNFSFGSSINLRSGKYWIIFTPTPESSLSAKNTFILNESISGNYYTSLLYTSSDGVSFDSSIYNGVAFTAITERGIVLPSTDAVYNQLGEPQNETVQYGDESDLNVFTSIAISTSANYIKKNFLDDNLVYAVETLIDSFGQNQYEISGFTGSASTSYFTMIANSLTENIERFEFFNPVDLTGLKLKSLGDYYTQSTNGTVQIAVSDFLGISTVEISSSPEFPISSTTVIDLPDYPQKYLQNIDFEFGDLGKKFIPLKNLIGYNINFIYQVTLSGVKKYLLISDTRVSLMDISTLEINVLKTLDNSTFVTATISSSGVLIIDSIGNIYNYSVGIVTLISSITPTPICSANQLTTSYIGVGTNIVSDKIYNRKRIYSYSNNVVTHLDWSTQIPEPEITFIYPTNFGLIIGAFDSENLIGKIYKYINGVLTQIYSTYLRPDAAVYSGNTGNLYIALGGSDILYAKYDGTNLGLFSESGVSISGSIVDQIATTRIYGEIFIVTDLNAYVFNEFTFVTTLINTPQYNPGDQSGLLIQIEDINLNLSSIKSSYKLSSFSNIYFDPYLSGYTTSFVISGSGSIVFNNIGSAGISTSFYLHIPDNVTLNELLFDNTSLSTTVFSGIFYSSIPKSFMFKATGSDITGIGTIALYNGVSSSFGVVGITSLTAPKTNKLYYKTGGTYDLFSFADGSLRRGDMAELSANQYAVYARFYDIIGNVSAGSNIASDIIYNQIQQQINGQALPTARIVEINSNNEITSFTPLEGGDGLVYNGFKISRQYGFFESDPFFAADVTSWDQIQVLASVPIPDTIVNGVDYGTSVTLYVKCAYNLNDLLSNEYSSQYQISSINSGVDYGDAFVNLLGNISTLMGTWIQFKLVLETASVNLEPLVKSVLITYNGAGKSVFITKTFNAANQSQASPTPKIRRGILTANFVTNDGIISFGYTTDENNVNPLSYTSITPNQIFTLSNPSSKIKFGIILKTASDQACFVDDFGIQLDLGPNSLYFMPPQANFEIEQYYDSLGIAVTHAYQFINKSIGIASAYNWSFGTSYPSGIATYYPPNEDASAGPAINRQNPIIQFTNTGPFIIGLFVTGFAENGIVFNSETYTKAFIAT